MEHDVHFLERLERVSLSLADLALSLYRDPELLRVILSHVGLPDGDSRVALPLGEGTDGPCSTSRRSSRATGETESGIF